MFKRPNASANPRPVPAGPAPRRVGGQRLYQAFSELSARERQRFLDRLSQDEDAHYGQIADARKNEPAETWDVYLGRKTGARTGA